MRIRFPNPQFSVMLGRGRRMLIGLVVLFLVGNLIITVDGLTDSYRPSDMIVVLGNEVLADGTPSSRLKARLDKAVELFEAGEARIIVVSGGVGASGWDEAEVMADYLVANGIDRSAIILDSDGVNTRATAENVAGILSDLGGESVIVVSQFFHLSRSRLAFKQAGVSEVGTAHAEYFEARDLFATPRDTIAYLKYFVAGA